MVTQGGETREMNSGVSWLHPATSARPEGIHWSGFAETEEANGRQWAWSLAGRCAVGTRAAGSLYYTIVVPAEGTSVQVQAGSKLVRTHRSSRPWQEFSGKLGLGPGDEAVFHSDRWNGNGAEVSALDTRQLALLFKHLRLVPERAEALPVKSRKICPYPFSKMEVYSPNFAPCCTWWLEEELAFEGNEGDPWNSGSAQALRASVLDGTYRFCKLDVCQAPLLESHELERSSEFDLPIAPENLAALREGKTEMPAGPSSVVVLADPRCNLACPSCRKELITGLMPQEEQQVAETKRLLDAYAPSLRSLVLASNGEVFFSPFLRERLREATRDRYPRLEQVEIISNGLLFDEKSWVQLQPGTSMIRKVRISIDAGNEPTYRAVRGGDWARLLRNLAWLAGLRREGRISSLRLNFVVRKENYSSLGDFFRMAEELGVDEIFVSRALPWTEAAFDFEHQDVISAGHPEHHELKQLWRGLTREPWPFRVLGNVTEALR